MDLSNENVIHIKKNGVEYIQYRKLLEYSDKVAHAFTIGLDKDYRIVSSSSTGHQLTLEQIEKNKNNYKNVCEGIGLNYNNIVRTRQIHGNIIKRIEHKVHENEPDFYEEEYAGTDGLITNKKGLTLCTSNADCILLMFYDTNKNVITNIHSGWKGTVQKIAATAIDKMQELYGTDPKDIICCISPSIRKCHFEVDEDVKNIFEEKFGYMEDVIKKVGDKWHIDTVKINIEMLKEKGLKEENIIDSKICTVCNSNMLHSYRATKHHNGLEVGIIGLK